MLGLCPFGHATARAEPEAPVQDGIEHIHGHEDVDETGDPIAHDKPEHVEHEDELVTNPGRDMDVPDGVDEPEDAGAMKVKVASASGDVLLSGQAGGIRPKPLPSPMATTVEEYARHVLTHIPYKDWCRHRVASRRPNNAYRCQRKRRAERRVPLLAVD